MYSPLTEPGPHRLQAAGQPEAQGHQERTAQEDDAQLDDVRGHRRLDAGEAGVGIGDGGQGQRHAPEGQAREEGQRLPAGEQLHGRREDGQRAQLEGVDALDLRGAVPLGHVAGEGDALRVLAADLLGKGDEDDEAQHIRHQKPKHSRHASCVSHFR